MKCAICKRFESKEKPCKGYHHNMEKYWERIEALAESEQQDRFDYEMAQAGGLDEVQRQERLRYYGEE